MTIKLAVKDDLDNISKLYVHNHKTTYKGLLSDEYLNSLTVESAKSRWEGYLSEEGNRVWVLYENSELLGFVAGKEDEEFEKTWYLDSLHVSETARGKGIGTLLIKTIGRYAFDNGYSAMSICVVKGNEKAKGLYMKLGAKPYKCFEDSFADTSANSEKLIWNDIKKFNL